MAAFAGFLCWDRIAIRAGAICTVALLALGWPVLGPGRMIDDDDTYSRLETRSTPSTILDLLTPSLEPLRSMSMGVLE